MIRNVTLLLLLALLLSLNNSDAQTVTGTLIYDSGFPAVNANVKLYAAPDVYEGVSDSLGVFNLMVPVITGVQDENLPTGYAVSNNFPNPFNPKTRIGVTMPAKGDVTVEVFNMLGQSVVPVYKETFNPGTNYIDIELNGLANGIYISRVTIDEKHVAIRKMVLIYGSQHLNTGGGNVTLPKPSELTFETVLDSLVVTAESGFKTFTGLPVLQEDTLDLGTLLIPSSDCPPTVMYEGRTYHTVVIGGKCWFRDNLNIGTMIPGTQLMTDNGIIEKYCYSNNESNCDIYGGLYSFNEATGHVAEPEGKQGICPEGWHIPSRDEYEEMIEAAGFNANGLKAIGQGTGNGTGTNTSGFSAKMAGRRYSNGTFGSIGGISLYWTSTEFSSFYGILMYMYSTGKTVGMPDQNRQYGFCIRCIKDE